MKNSVKFNGVIFLLFCMNAALAYEPGTHLSLAASATQESVLKEDSGVLADLGLKKFDDPAQLFPDPQAGESIPLGPNNTDWFTARISDTILNLIATGAALEDEFPRSLYHFYDPVSGHIPALNIGGVAAPYSAPDWALGEAAGQFYSLKNAHDDFYKALTAAGEAERNRAFGGLFVSLGHVLHLVQDMAQPQHVRNDVHCDMGFCHLLGRYNPSLYA